MRISSLFQTGMRKLLILGLVSSLAACGGGGGGGKQPDPAPTSSSPVSSLSSSALSSSLGSSISSSSISSLGDSSSSSTSSVAAIDTTPDTFSFTPVTGVAVNSNVTSAAITITGFNTALPISIANGEYSINGGPFTREAGTINNGHSVSLRVMSAATIATETQAVVTIGGIAQSFSLTTTSIKSGALNIAGVVTTVAGTPISADGVGTAARFNGPNGTIMVGGNLYVTDTANHKIRKIDIATSVVTTLAGSDSFGGADGIGAAARFTYPTGITTDGSHLYVADTSNNKIRKIVIATGAVTTLAGSGSSGSADGIGTAASFYQPSGITTDGTHLFVADSENNKIRKIEIATGVATTLAGSGSRGSEDGTGVAASFNSPEGIATDGTYLYVADRWNHKIRKIMIATGVVATLAGGDSRGSDDGVGAAAKFDNPGGITTDGTHLYVVDRGNDKVRKIVLATGVVTTLAGGVSGSADGAGAAAGFYLPGGISIDGAHLYIADSGNNKIRKIHVATGVVTTLAGSVSSANGTGAAASFFLPAGITTDGTHLYVADTLNNKIRKIEIATNVVTTLAGSGSTGSADGIGAAASFHEPQGITTDGTHIYVTEYWNHKIRKIDIATGVVTTLAGSGSGGSADGTGAAASFQNPRGITNNGTHLYVADTSNHKIRKIEIATGMVTTLAGTGLEQGGGADGTGTAADFLYPAGITTDGTHLYVADTYNHKIRKIEIATAVVTTLAGSGSSGSTDGIGASATFTRPTGITTDGTHLYVADKWGQKIRKVEISTGMVTALAGSGVSGTADGVGTAAQFYNPSGITTDGFSLFVTDTENNTIRKIE